MTEKIITFKELDAISYGPKLKAKFEELGVPGVWRHGVKKVELINNALDALAELKNSETPVFFKTEKEIDEIPQTEIPNSVSITPSISTSSEKTEKEIDEIPQTEIPNSVSITPSISTSSEKTEKEIDEIPQTEIPNSVSITSSISTSSEKTEAAGTSTEIAGGPLAPATDLGDPVIVDRGSPEDEIISEIETELISESLEDNELKLKEEIESLAEKPKFSKEVLLQNLNRVELAMRDAIPFQKNIFVKKQNDILDMLDWYKKNE